MWSVSRVECYEKCPYQYRLRYLDGVGVLDDYEADNPLTCGTALHE
ncbi:PD-(D/E)XK nuclease family protein, partial [Sinorhizobium sp. GL28]